MEEKQAHALLIAGDQSRFSDGILKFQKFLIGDVGLNPHNIRVVLCTYEVGRDYILEETQMFFNNLRMQGNLADAVLYYRGHGGKAEFFPNDSSVTYKEWGRLIDSKIDFIFINDSCYSGSAIPPFREIGLLPERGLVIASSREDEISYGDLFLDTLLESYRNGMPFRRKEIGTSEVTGKILLTVPKDDEPISAEDKETLIKGPLKYKEVYVPYPRPEVLGKVQHPVRHGKNLDFILFKK